MAESTDINTLQTLLQTVRAYLHSEMLVTRSAKGSLAHMKVKVQNTASSSGGFAQVVFVGVGISIMLSGDKDTLDELRRTETRYPIQLPGETDDKAVITYVNSTVEYDDEGYGTERRSRIKGDTLFPGESKEYGLAIPIDCLPFLSVKVNGVVSAGNLFQSAHLLLGLDIWSKPTMIDFFKALSTIDMHRALKQVIANAPSLGPRTTLEETTNFRKVITQAVDHVVNSRHEVGQLWSMCRNIEMIVYLENVVSPYLNSIEKACLNASQALASGDVERMNGSMSGFDLLLKESKEVDRKRDELMSKMGVRPE